jgi:hypothetical protein
MIVKNEHLICSEVLTAVKISTVVFWVVILCNLVGGYQNFREAPPSDSYPEDHNQQK